MVRLAGGQKPLASLAILFRCLAWVGRVDQRIELVGTVAVLAIGKQASRAGDKLFFNPERLLSLLSCQSIGCQPHIRLGNLVR